MRRLSLLHTVRGRILLLALVVEAVMLTLMVTNSMRLLNGAMTSQARWQAAQMAPVLNASLKAPVVQQDYATIQAVIDESRETEGIDYIVVSDRSGRQVAASGWEKGKPLPEPTPPEKLHGYLPLPRYDVAVDIKLGPQLLGKLQFGLDLGHINAARSTLLTQGVVIALLELLLSSIVLYLLAVWLTRNLTTLTRASLDVAAGNLTPAPVPEGSDDVGQLGIAFNTMSRTISERISDLISAKESAELNEKARAEGEERLNLVLDGSNDGFWLWDIPSGRIEINRRWAEMIGYTMDEIVPHIQTWVDLVNPEDLETVQAVLKDHLSGVTPFYESEYRVRAKNGEWVWVLDRGKVVQRDEAGAPLRAAGTHTDITARKAAEEQLAALNQSLQNRIDAAIAELREKDQLMIIQDRQAAMGEMIGNIAHQWRQPLNALAMLLGNIKFAFQFKELDADYIDKTYTSGNRLIQKMSTTINDFRNFFRPDKKVVEFPVREQIRQAVTLVEAGLVNQNITITLDAPQDYILSGFPNEYSQVLLNLLSNSRDAIKEASIPEGVITILLYEQDGRACVAVRDNGGGIPNDVIDKIFEPYFSTKNMGTGIGLYMSKMIIEQNMNGSLKARNIDGGAEFIVAVPLGANQ